MSKQSWNEFTEWWNKTSGSGSGSGQPGGNPDQGFQSGQPQQVQQFQQVQQVQDNQGGARPHEGTNVRISGSGYNYSFEEANGFRPRHASTPRDQSVNNVNNDVAEVEYHGGEQFARGASGGRGSGKKKKDEEFEKVGKKVTKITIETEIFEKKDKKKN